MATFWDLLPAGPWPTQPFIPPFDPTQAAWPPAALPPWNPATPSAFGWPMFPATSAGAPPDAASVPPWESAIPQGAVAPAGAIGDAGAADDPRVAEAKRAYAFAKWFFGPPSTPQSPATRAAATIGPDSPTGASSVRAPQPVWRASGGDNASTPVPAVPRFPTAPEPPDSMVDVPGVGAVPVSSPGLTGAEVARAAGDLPVVYPLQQLVRRMASGAMENWRANDAHGGEYEAYVQNHGTMPKPGEIWAPPGGGQNVANALGDMIAAPAVAFHEAMQPPPEVPNYVEVGADGHAFVWRNGEPIPWENVEPDKAYAWYEQMDRRANFAPRMALGILGTGANFVPRLRPAPVRPAVEPPPIEPPPIEPLAGEGAPATAADQPASPVVGPSDLADWRAHIRVPTTHTVGVARTNVPGMEDMTFKGASPLVRKEAGLPPAEPGPIESQFTLPRDRGHVEEDLANQFVREARKRGLQPQDLEGYELSMHLSKPSCPSCRSGLASGARPGVLKQLSTEPYYPGLTIHIGADVKQGTKARGPTRFTIRNGNYIRRSDRR